MILFLFFCHVLICKIIAEGKKVEGPINEKLSIDKFFLALNNKKFSLALGDDEFCSTSFSMFENANFDDSTNTCYKPNITDQNQTPLVDFDDFQSLSETDDELDESNYRISESLFWSQSITPGKYYTRVF